MKRSTFILLCLEGAVLSFNVAAVAALVPSIAKEFVLSQFFVGKMIWMYMLPYGLAALLYGPLVRAIDARKVELTCIFFFSLANLLAALSRNIQLLFAARFLMGMFGASVIPLGLILIGRHIQAQQKGKFVGIFFSATFVASLLGLFLSGLINWRLIFLIPALLGFILFIAMFFYLPSFKEDRKSFSVNYLNVLKNKRVVSVFTYIFFISIFYHGIQQWLGVYFSRSYGFNQLTISLLITLTSLSGVFGEAFGGIAADLFGRVRTASAGIALMIISAFLLVIKMPVFAVALLLMAWGLGWTFNHAGLCTLLTDLPEEFLNESASLNSSVRFISGGLGTALSGLLMQKSFHLGFISLGFCLLGLLLFGTRLIRKA